ncbi:exonuclease V [Melanogaster broomeanus]|nr:exonuclease V [Melanogaster broomeanus]
MSCDEFDDYDFSEFTEEELAWIDADISRKLESRSKPSEVSSSSFPANPPGNGNMTGGPAIQIAIELDANTVSGNLKAAPPLGERVPASYEGRTPALQPKSTIRAKSPFQQFCSWKKSFSVTDLVSPVWCEVQYEYGLYGRRHRPLEQRPPSFKSKSGKEIRVHQEVAQKNDRRLKRGKSVHRALEEELRPEKVAVPVVSEEERFGLRRLIDGLNELVVNGLTRELPVFTITHAQVVFGVIDEVFRSPLTPEIQEENLRTRPAATGPPGSPAKKKQRRSISPLQQWMTSFLPEPQTKVGGPPDPTLEATEAVVHPGQFTTPVGSSCTSSDAYELRIIDYKTRQASYVPRDDETLSPRLQLMLYHRMLSSVLAPDSFDFDLLWRRLKLDPTKRFSDRFVRDIKWDSRIDTTPKKVDHVDLNLLVAEWTSAVHSERAERSLVRCVSPELQIVYRRSVLAGKWRGKGRDEARETLDMDNPLEALMVQEELDIARAVEDSLRHIGRHVGEASRLAQSVAQNIKQAGSSNIGNTDVAWKLLVSPSSLEKEDSELAWAIQQSLLDTAHGREPMFGKYNWHSPYDSVDDEPPINGTKSRTAEPEDRSEEQTTSDIFPIIGTKEFRMNDSLLDAHLADVLEWWHGARPARGVEVTQTNRCFTCEYRDSCEWREKKAKEAAAMITAFKLEQ